MWKWEVCFEEDIVSFTRLKTELPVVEVEHVCVVGLNVRTGMVDKALDCQSVGNIRIRIDNTHNVCHFMLHVLGCNSIIINTGDVFIPWKLLNCLVFQTLIFVYYSFNEILLVRIGNNECWDLLVLIIFRHLNSLRQLHLQ